MITTLRTVDVALLSCMAYWIGMHAQDTETMLRAIKVIYYTLNLLVDVPQLLGL